ncbi:hypothetical protein D6C99_10658 [Aureobasidium pullulans]|nr:hypothetical protein D6C99_10658 [Aureobasidium pullulans]
MIVIFHLATNRVVTLEMMFGFFQRVAEMPVKRPESLLSERALKNQVTETVSSLCLFHISNHAQMVMPRNATPSP